MQSTPLLVQLQEALDSYPGALARAAQYIIENPEKVVRQSLSELSAYSKTGQASIVRLCQELGFNGFTDLKLSLAAEVALGRIAADDDREAAEPLDEVSDILCRSITETRALVPLDLLHDVAARLPEFKRINVYGAGVSGIGAELLSYRLLRLGINANAMRDAELAHEVANSLTEDTAAIAISQSGLTSGTVEFLKCAKHNQAFTIAITCGLKSSLAQFADAVLPMARLRKPLYGGHVSDVPRVVFVIEALAASLEAAYSHQT